MSAGKKAPDKPNNFPHEGEHNTITRDGLKQLEAKRSKPNSSLDYTIGGTRETVVHSNVEADRNYALRSGHKRMNEMSRKIQTDHVFSANKGRSKAQFQASNDKGKTYAQMQRERVAKAQEKRKQRTR